MAATAIFSTPRDKFESALETREKTCFIESVVFLVVFHRVSGVFCVGYNALNTLTAGRRAHRGGGLVDGAVEHDVQAPAARGAHHGAEARTLVHLARRGGAAPVADSWERLSRCF